jgi:DNA segregation ATPase FtsK/SpoIIIE, S-DNA-T family
LLFELLSSMVVGGLVGASYLHQQGLGSNDTQNIVRIAENAGLVARDGRKIRIHRRSRKDSYTEYVFQLPQGLSAKQFQEKLDRFQDGLNAKRRILDISLKDFREINWKGDIVEEIRKLAKKKKTLHKEVEIQFDGMLKFRVYHESLTTGYRFEEAISKRFDEWEVPVGLDRSGNLIKHDFEAIPHMVLGGATCYGKSNFLNALIVSLLKNHPEDVSLTLIDLKGGVEFGDYENVRQVKNIAYEPEDALKALENAYNELRSVQYRLRRMGKKKVQDAGIKERHFVIIDEVGELNPEEAVTKEDRVIKEQCQTYMSQIARLGAGFGFRQILATQYGTGDVIPRQCKQNSDAKLCFRVRNATASRVVLDEAGAEELPLVRGRAIYQTDRRHIVQTPVIDESAIKDTIGPNINFKARKDVDENARQDNKGTAPRKHTLIVEEIGIS